MIRFTRERCQPWRICKARCRLCVEACPVEGAIAFDGSIISVDADKCVGCGICATACPSGALELDRLGDGALMERLVEALSKEGGGLEAEALFVCALGPEEGKARRYPAGHRIVKLPCLALLDESILTALAVKGVKDISIDTSKCAACSLNKGLGFIERSIGSSQAILGHLGQAKSVRTADTLLEGENGKKGRKRVKPGAFEIKPGGVYSRREFFGFLRDKAKDNYKGPGDEPMKAPSGTRIPGMPERRAILLDALREAGAGGIPAVNGAAFPLQGRSLEISDGCVMCSRCGLFCPTGALRKVVDEGEARIEFTPGLCTGCYECAEFCPVGALGYGGSFDLKRLLDGPVETLAKRKVVACASCGGSYMPEVEKNGCPSCRKKRTLEGRITSMLFGSGGPQAKRV